MLQNHTSTEVNVETLKIAKDLLKPHGKLLIDLGNPKFLQQTSLQTKLTIAEFRMDPMKIAESQSIVIAAPISTVNGVSQDHEPLWLVKLRSSYIPAH